MNLEVNKEDKTISGFINSNGELEFTISKNIDGGYLTLEDRIYKKDELVTLLEEEIDDLINQNIPTLFILGHEICLNLVNGESTSRNELDDEVYEISHAIMQGDENGEILIESKNIMCLWRICK